MHQPVLLKEVIQYLDPKHGEHFIDGTVNGGGHAFAILEKTAPSGKLLGIDWDAEILKKLEASIRDESLRERMILVNDNFARVGEIAELYRFSPVHGILFDFGFSSYHIEQSGAGFSFQKDEPLDMRYHRMMNDLDNDPTAAEILNAYSEEKLENMFKEFGEEHFAARIAGEVVRVRALRPFQSTFDLVRAITSATPLWYQRKKIHPATKVFQALRIAVNHELENIAAALANSFELLAPGGKIAAISFHSLEDRIVKNIFKEKAEQKIIKIATPKPLQATRAEQRVNPRARPAKLRVAQRI